MSNVKLSFKLDGSMPNAQSIAKYFRFLQGNVFIFCHTPINLLKSTFQEEIYNFKQIEHVKSVKKKKNISEKCLVENVSHLEKK